MRSTSARTTVPRLGHALSLCAAMLAVGCEAELATDLSDVQADEIVLALDGEGIGADKARSEATGGARYRVVVAHGDVPAALAVLRDHDLPRPEAPGFAEMFSDGSLVPSAAEERARYAAAIAGELSRSLEAMAGVRRARVHVAMPEAGSRTLDEGPARARASVLLLHNPGVEPDADAVRALVAGGVQELAIEDVAVVASPARARSGEAARLSRIGPIAVSRGTAGVLKAVLAASFALNLLLVLALVWIRRRASDDDPSRHGGAPAKMKT
ncbi:MAG: hypothetical protein RLP09_23590 [Sandaracinaceae bacterium]